MQEMKLSDSTLSHIEEDIAAAERELDDDAESIITNERYIYIASLIMHCLKKKSSGQLTTSDKIDRIVTNRFAGSSDFCGDNVPRLLYFRFDCRHNRNRLGE